MKKNYNLAESSMHIGFMVMLSLISMSFSFTGCTSKPSDPKGEEKLDMTIYENIKFGMSASALQSINAIEGKYKPPTLVLPSEVDSYAGKSKSFLGVDFDESVFCLVNDSLRFIFFESRFDDYYVAGEAANNIMWNLHDTYGGKDNRSDNLEIIYSKIVGAKNIILRFQKNPNPFIDTSWSYELRLTITKSTKEEREEAAIIPNEDIKEERDTIAIL